MVQNSASCALWSGWPYSYLLNSYNSVVNCTTAALSLLEILHCK